MRKYKRKWLRTKSHWRFSLNDSIKGTTKKLSDGAKDISFKNDCACVNCIDYRSREHTFGPSINTKECLVDKASTLTVQNRRTKYFAKKKASKCQQAVVAPIDSDYESLIEHFSKLYITEPTKEHVSRTDHKPEEEVKKIVQASERVNIHKTTNSDESYESADSNGKYSAELNDMHEMRERLEQLTRFEKEQPARQGIADLDDGYKTMSESVISESLVGYCNWYTWGNYEWNENFVLLDKSTRNKYASSNQLAHETKEKSADLFAFRDLGKYEEYRLRSVAAEWVENIECNSVNLLQKSQEHNEDFWKSQKVWEEPVDDNLENIFDSLLNISATESSISSVEDNLLHISVSDEFTDEQYQGDISTISPDDFHEAETFETVKCHKHCKHDQLPFNGYDGCDDHYHWKFKGYAPLNDSNSSSTDSDNYDTPQEYEKCMRSMENKFAFIFDRTERLHRICYDTEYCKYDSIRTLNDCSDRDVQCEMDYSVGLTKRRRWSKCGSKSKYNDMLRGKPPRRGAVMTRKWSNKVVWKSDEIPLLQESTFDESFVTCVRSTSI